MNVYKTTTFPLRVPGRQGFVTELQDFPRFVVTHLARGLVGELSEMPRMAFIESAAIKWHNEDSCVASLLIDRSDQIHQRCLFTARQAEIEPTWLQLTPNDYVLSNLSDVRLYCRDILQPSPFQAPCMPCFIHLDCGCTLNYAHGPSVFESARPESVAETAKCNICLLYTSDAADEEDSVDL